MGLISRVSSRTYRKLPTTTITTKYVAAYLLAAQSGSAPSKDQVTKILELAPTSKPINSTKSSPNWTVKTLKTSSPKVWVSSPLFHLVVLPQLVVPPLPPVVMPQPLKRRKNPPKKKNPTPIWDSIFLDKKFKKKTTTAEINKRNFISRSI